VARESPRERTLYQIQKEVTAWNGFRCTAKLPEKKKKRGGGKQKGMRGALVDVILRAGKGEDDGGTEKVAGLKGRRKKEKAQRKGLQLGWRRGELRGGFGNERGRRDAVR